MKFIAVVILVFSFQVFALSSSQTEFELGDLKADVSKKISAFAQNTDKNIRKGDFEVGGSFNLGYSELIGFNYSVSPKIQYFVIDNLSLGGVLDISKYTSATYIGLGPSASYYFYESGAWAANLNQSVIFQEVDSRFFDVSAINGLTGLGMNYFFTPEVAAGLNLNYRYQITSDEPEFLSSVRDEVNFEGAFYFFF